ncbi:ATP-dependent Clp protease ATP-binding subunit [Candidatus Vampirococcus lugosii]|uniref:ATP-dependent Clp protease ATP-binding protein n=1 Tax=Candidatus Vampirococcus lugosii TaxID=2789015 RepID=A0ABS5QJW3_9BACT|nr:ATP-dependent Clp protease ATP-binding protein [Candidatus Vampirococcus lugosii]
MYINNNYKSIKNESDQDLIDGTNNGDDSKIDTSSQVEEKKLTIEHFGTNLNFEARNGYLDPVIGRYEEIQQTIYTLLRKTKNNPLLIGEAGVGKTAIVEGLAQKIENNDVPEKLKNKRIFMLDVGGLVAGTKYRGEFESRLKTIIQEATDPTNNIILFIDELHTIIGAGNTEGGADAANILKPFLSRGKLQLIGATTYDEYQKHIEKDPALKRRFQEVNVDEPSNEDTKKILFGIREKFESFHGVNIADNAIHTSVELSSRYILNKQLPDKAIDLIDEACARQSTLGEKLEKNDEYKQVEKKLEILQKKIQASILNQDYFKAAELKEEEENLKQEMKNIRSQNSLPKHLRTNVDSINISEVLSMKTGIPKSKLNESELNKLKDLDTLIKKDLVGQDEAVQSLVNYIKRNRISVIDRQKPIASFLFLGPSGVGKTYITKLLAKHFFESEKSLIRVDMSEYMDRNSSSKLIGSAPGYVGYDEGGTLTESVRRNPYSIILFDEIEKASPDVLNILLQILDEGTLKDNKGRLIDFKNTIIILTSNIGSEEFAKKVVKIGFGTNNKSSKDSFDKDFDIVKERVMEKLKSEISAELLNRLDNTIVFKPLSKEIMIDIFQKEYKEFSRLWKEKKGISVPKYNVKNIQSIIDEIYAPEYGARPISRYIHEQIEPKIIEEIIENV